MSPVTFMLEGPVGDFEGAEKIAKLIKKYLEEKEGQSNVTEGT